MSTKRSRSLLAIVGSVLLAGVIYATTVLLYAADLSGADSHTAHQGSEGGALTLVIAQRGIDPTKEELTFQLKVDTGSALVDATGTGLTVPVRVQIRDAAGTRTVTFGEESLSSEVIVALLTPERRLEAWPFDRYAADLLITAERGTGENQYEPIAADLMVDGGLPGWDLAAEEESVTDASAATFDIALLIGRSFSTVAFGAVLVTSMVIMLVIALAVSINVARGRRRMELIFLGWIAGMLFAVPALRNFLPGQPPVGSWVDFLVVLWVIVGLIVALALLVLSWFRSARSRPDGADP